MFMKREGQDTQKEVLKRNLCEELEEREGKHFSSNDKSYNDDRDRRKGNHLLLEGSRRDTEERSVPHSVDADDSAVEVRSDDEGDDEDEDEDDTLALMAELEQIRKERTEEKLKKREEEPKVKKAGLLQGNPLLNIISNFQLISELNTVVEWDDDVVFKNEAHGETKTPKRFIKDTIRSDFHRKFLHKYMK
ncbi:hypothetical protein UlMin_003937 [Ulmus minor]